MSGARYNILPAPPKRGKGVRRLNRLPLLAGICIGVLVLLVFAYTFHQRLEQSKVEAVKAQEDNLSGDSGRAKAAVALPAGTPANPVAHDKPSPPPAHEDTNDQASATLQPQPGVDLAEQERIQAWRSYYQRQNEENRKSLEADNSALTESSTVTFAQAQQSPAAPPGVAPGVPVGAVGGSVGANLDGSPTMPGGDGGQAEKRAFLNQGGDVLGLHEDLPAALHGPKHNTIMEGTAIPGVMVGGMTSDMPGMVKGQITQNICDTETGDNLLIPQGTLAVGTYDNSVTNGQERIGVIWNRLILPDASSLQIGSMEGADQGGYAGFKDQVNTHFWDKLSASLLISIAGAAVQLAQPQAPVGGYYSPTQIGTGAMTQQMSQLGNTYAQAGLQVPNTLEVRPGFLFNIMVRQDIPLPSYHGQSCKNPGVDNDVSAPVNLGPVLR